jgi:hypothetical protein
MPGKHHRFTPKQDRMVKHIIQSEEKRGVSQKTAMAIAYGHVSKLKKKK